MLRTSIPTYIICINNVMGNSEQYVLLPECCDISMVLHNICNMCSYVLPDMSALALRHCMPSCSCIHIRQITTIHVTCYSCNMSMSGLPDMYISGKPRVHMLQMLCAMAPLLVNIKQFIKFPQLKATTLTIN